MRHVATVVVFDLTARRLNRQVFDDFLQEEAPIGVIEGTAFGYIDCWRHESLCIEAGATFLPAIVARFEGDETVAGLPIDNNQEARSKILQEVLMKAKVKHSLITDEDEFTGGTERAALKKQVKLSKVGMLWLCAVSIVILAILGTVACLSESSMSDNKNMQKTLDIELQSELFRKASTDCL